MTWLIHVANVLFLASYSVRDVLWLRLLTIVAMSLLLPFNYYYPGGPLWTPMAWNTVFLLINVGQAWRLVLERRPVRLTFEQQQLYQQLFSSLRPRQFLALFSAGNLAAHEHGQVIVDEGKPLDRLSLVAQGTVSVELDGRAVAELGEGRFVGEMSWLTGEVPRARVIAGTSCRCLHWPSAHLRSFLAEQPDTRTVLQNLLGADLAHKLRGGPIGPAPA